MISSAPSFHSASLPSRRRLAPCLLCQETQQQNLKPPELLPPPSSLSLPMISDFGRKMDSDSVSHVKLGHLLLQICLGFEGLPPLPYFVFTQRAWLGYPCLPLGGLRRPEWSQFLPALTVSEIRGAADKGICRPSGCVHVGRVTSGAGPVACRP